MACPSSSPTSLATTLAKQVAAMFIIVVLPLLGISQYTGVSVMARGWSATLAMASYGRGSRIFDLLGTERSR